MAQLYQACLAGRPAPLAPLPIQYADFALWQRGRLSGERREALVAYWKARLADSFDVLHLPLDHPRPPLQSHRGATRSLLLTPERGAALKRLARERGATLFMALLAAFQTLLARYAATEQVSVGTPAAGRPRTELEGLIGCFLNTLVLRLDLAGDPPAAELLERARDMTLAAFAHQELPFELVLEALQPPRSLSHTPLFQVMLNLVTAMTAAPAMTATPATPATPAITGRLQLPGLAAAPLPAAAEEAKFDLTLYVRDAEAGGLSLSLVYCADLFEAATVERLLGHFDALLQGLVEAPQQRLSTLPLIAAAARRELLARGPAAAPRNPYFAFPPAETEQSIPRRFFAQAARWRERPAVSGESGAWSYGELAERVRAVAAALAARLGAGAGQVALLLRHDTPMAAAVLGTLAAGKTYVPLDVSHPAERLRAILADAAPQALLADASTLEQARALAGEELPLLCCEAPGAPVAAAPLAVEAAADAPAYLLYTSGSTGQPKAVVQSHRNVLRHIRAYTNALHLGPADRLSLLASYAFDAAVMDLFGALLNGASLHLFSPREQGTDVLARWLAAEAITVYHSTPTVYRSFLQSPPGEMDLSTLRLVVLGGEEVVPHDLDLFRRHFPADCLLVNGLGPTESTLALQQIFDHGAAARWSRRSRVPVGQPVADTEVLLLNGAGEEVDLLACGEIAIRSEQLALGYWRQPELTARAFLAAAPGDGRRTYLTGDLGRLLPEGGIEVLGRRDLQVKIRGQRVEIGEVESHLLGHPAVAEAAVCALAGSGAGARTLAAFVVAAAGAALDAAELRACLRRRLPELMVPSFFVPVAALPRTASGKIDRLELGRWRAPQRRAAESSAPAATPLAEVLAETWKEVLGLAEIGAEEDFFAIGGHSLHAAQVVSRLRRALGCEVPLRSLFEHPTVAGLARELENGLRRAAGMAALPPLTRGPRGGPGGPGDPGDPGDHPPASFAQERLWFLEQLAPGNGAYVLATAVSLAGELDAGRLRGALAALTARHETLRTTFAEAAGRPLQVIAPPQPPPLPLLDLSALPAARRHAAARQLAAAAARRPFDLQRGPLLRAALVRLDARDHVLLVAMHHIVSDGWSLGVFGRELTALYGGAALPELPVQYADYARWQRGWLSGEVLAREIAFWRHQLGTAPVLALPTDRPRPAVRRCWARCAPPPGATAPPSSWPCSPPITRCWRAPRARATW
jgi:amino acid adenylation domain-containing protein